MKKTVILLLMSYQLLAFGYEIDYSKTYNKIVAENKTLKFQIKDDGTMILSEPSFSASPSLNYTNSEKMADHSLNDLVALLLKKKTNSIDRKLTVIKSNEPHKRFYSSEVDNYLLRVSDEGLVLFELEFSNWQELNHYYEQLGEWQVLVDLVRKVENHVIATKSAMKKRGDK